MYGAKCLKRRLTRGVAVVSMAHGFVPLLIALLAMY